MPEELKNWRTRFDNVFEVVDGKVCFDDAVEIKAFISNLLRVAEKTVKVEKVVVPQLPEKEQSFILKLQSKISFLTPIPKQSNETSADYSKRVRFFNAAKKAFYRELKNFK